MKRRGQQVKQSAKKLEKLAETRANKHTRTSSADWTREGDECGERERGAVVRGEEPK